MGVTQAKSYHLAAPGYGNVAGVALGLANLFIESINAKYGLDLPGVNPMDFTGLYIN